MAFENLKSTGIAYLLTRLKGIFVQIKDAVRSVNGNEPDEYGDITVNTVPYAENLESESSFRNYDAFIQRMAGGESSVEDGDAWLMSIMGNNVHEGYVAEDISYEITPDREDQITISIDRDTFVGAVSVSGIVTLSYATGWSANPATYGITVTGTPESGDTITITYVKEERGTITVSNPQKFIATGWNLFDYTNSYAKVIKYAFGYRIEGAYTSLKYSQTVGGTQSSITVSDGYFDVPADGYVWVTGGNSATTAIYPTWEDWTDNYGGAFQAYDEHEIDFSAIMESKFPNGLLKAGSVADEINLNLGQAIVRVERLEYTAENLATAQSSGREFEYDEDYIYLAKATAISSSVTINGGFPVNEHGLEYFTETDVPVIAELLYGSNLKNKLERDVLTISQQELSASQRTQVRTNLGVPSASDLNSLVKLVSYSYVYSIPAGGYLTITREQLGITDPEGYTLLGLVGYNTRSQYTIVSRVYPGMESMVFLVNTRNSVTAQTFTIRLAYIKTGFA